MEKCMNCGEYRECSQMEGRVEKVCLTCFFKLRDKDELFQGRETQSEAR